MVADRRLHNEFWDPWIWYILPAVAVLQWLLIIPLSYHLGVWGSIDAFAPTSLVEDQKIAFLEDFFYTIWNVFPLLLFAAYAYAHRLGRPLLESLDEHFELSDAAARVESVKRIRDSRLIHGLIILAALGTTLYQIPKQLRFIRTGEIMYWWDWRISLLVFDIRFVALFFNTLLVALIGWHILVLLFALNRIAKEAQVKPDFFHPDNCCGLEDFGNVVFVLTVPLVLGAFVGVAAWFDHRFTHGLAQTVTDFAVVAITTSVAGVMFLSPAYHIHKKIRSDLEQIKRSLRERAQPGRYADILRNRQPVQGSQGDHQGRDSEDGPSDVLLYRSMGAVTPWPFDEEGLMRKLVVIVSPVGTFLVEHARIFVTTHWERLLG